MLVMNSTWRRWAEARRARARRQVEQPLPVMRWLLATTLAVAVVLGGGTLAMWLLGAWSTIPAGVPDPDLLRLERIKTGLTVAAGLAAGVTLLMTLRRQAWSEQAQRFTQSDALEQRITELYVAAAEQLGSDKAAVRLAGLYALERLGQDHPRLRQTVVDVICAYLRMPYTPPAEVLRQADGSSEGTSEAAPSDGTVDEAMSRQELQVRLTAQRLLANHLRVPSEPGEPESAAYWLGPGGEHMDLNLAGATLVLLSLKACRLGRIDLSRAQLHERADLGGVQFHERADLSGAQFHGDADLGEAQFHGAADLGGAQFHRYAFLEGARFHRDADLTGVQFHGRAILDWVQFHGSAGLHEAQFHERADLTGAQFHQLADLGGVRFHMAANLKRVQFRGDAYLNGTQFHDAAILDGAQFHGNAYLARAEFYGLASISTAEFRKSVDLRDSRLADLQPLPAPWIAMSRGPDGLLVVGVRNGQSDLG